MCKIISATLLTQSVRDQSIKCSDITEREFAVILSELSTVMRRVNEVEVIIGFHEAYGAVTLVRDETRCILLVDEAACLDRLWAEQAFLVGGLAADVAGRG